MSLMEMIIAVEPLMVLQIGIVFVILVLVLVLGCFAICCEQTSSILRKLLVSISRSPPIHPKTSVWWDIQDCHAPPDVNPSDIARNVNKVLREHRLVGPSTITVYGYFHKHSQRLQDALESTGIKLQHILSGRKDVKEKEILVSMALWTIDNPPPGNIVLVSADPDFSTVLRKLRVKGFNVVLARPDGSIPDSLLDAPTSSWYWERLVRGEADLVAFPRDSTEGPGTPVLVTREVEVETGTNDKKRQRRKCVNVQPQGISDYQIIGNALDRLREEMLLPTEENIYSSVVSSANGLAQLSFHLGDALNRHVASGALVLRCVAGRKIFFPAGQVLWYYVPPEAPRTYPPGTWDAFRAFLRSNKADKFVRSANPYHAGLVVRKHGGHLLSLLPLGELINLVHTSATVKQWIQPHPVTWSPVLISLEITRSRLPPQRDPMKVLKEWLPSKLTIEGYNLSALKDEFRRERGITIDRKLSDVVEQFPDVVEVRRSGNIVKLYPPMINPKP